MSNPFKHLFLPHLFFWALGAIICLFAASFAVGILFPVAQIALAILGLLFLVDVSLLFNGKLSVGGKRSTPKIMSLGNEQSISWRFENNTSLPLRAKIIDELPYQFQIRDFGFNTHLNAQDPKEFSYQLRPLVRGIYQFGNVNLFLRTPIGLAERRYIVEAATDIPVYPSILDMKEFELTSISSRAGIQGIKKMRRIGHSFEFEQIKEYTQGDDYQSVNWKATSRVNKLMINQYEDEKSQQVYSLIDKSRVMKMPFNGLSLLDYAINTSLVISNTALRKHDKAGLITFSDKVGSIIKADKSRSQLKRILDALYKEEEGQLESNYELLYHVTRQVIKVRSLIFLFTNFENVYSLTRVLPILRKIAKKHLLVVVLFDNTEIIEYVQKPATSVEDIYSKTIGEKFIHEKHEVVKILRQYGIQTIRTQPHRLTVNAINKYLELKARGLI